MCYLNKTSKKKKFFYPICDSMLYQYLFYVYFLWILFIDFSDFLYVLLFLDADDH